MSEKGNKPAYPWWGKFKKGDKVVICRKVATHTEGYKNSWVPSMDPWIGKEVTILSVADSQGESFIEETDFGWPLAGPWLAWRRWVPWWRPRKARPSTP